MVEIYVDADACPVKHEAFNVALRHGLKLHMVSNTWMRMDNHPLLNRVVVGEGADVADDWIAEHISASDLCLTADIPLASRCIAKGASVLDFKGKAFTEDGIGMALAMRDLHSHLRDIGEISGAGPSYSKQDRSNFLNAIEVALQRLKATT